ncbi:MAG: CoB--CoM heterodisulfide reductase subunit C [Candidatus Methanomethylophilaceae archaeon]|jgi:heterodisulfide reductase subunit C|nr:CoB--CoM heterodisulfide reductase subunit C [Candidatus Methanomethylophilaceae archaeon]NLF33554.1 CoB--CoM heterodisulfide reductase subunit C [Thermoplasmatales archaeon]
MVTPNPEFTKEIESRGGGQVLMCFQCGTCTASCPSGKQTSFRTRKLMRMAQLGLKDDIVNSEELWQCTTCYSCVERCPREVPIVDIIIALRNIAVDNGHMYDEHKKVATALSKYGHTVSINDNVKAQRKDLGLPEVPPTVLANDKAKADLDKILKATGFDKIIG